MCFSSIEGIQHRNAVICADDHNAMSRCLVFIVVGHYTVYTHGAHGIRTRVTCSNIRPESHDFHSHYFRCLANRVYCATVLNGHITGLARSSVRPSIAYGLLTKKNRRRRKKNKISINVKSLGQQRPVCY